MTNLRQMDFNPANQSAFGTLENAELTPSLQGDFAYGINTQIWQTAVTSGTGATVDTNAERLRIQSGTDAAGYAYIQTRKPVKYRAGQGTVMRFTPLYTAGVADNIQLWGMFGMSSNAPYDGYGFGFNGTDFGIAHYIRGTPAWTAQASWNGATLPFTWNKTFGIPVMIKYPYLGYGNIFFYVQNPTSGAWILAHTIRYANTTATTQLSNPTLYFTGYTANSGNTTNVTMYSGSFGGFISGPRSFVGNPRGTAFNNKNAITTETNLLSLRNATTYNGQSNRGLIRLTSLSWSSSAATGIATFLITVNPTLGGTPAFAPFNGTTADNGVTITSGNSVVSVDTAGTTVTGGSRSWSVTVDNPNSTGAIDMTKEDIFIAPGEIATLSGTSTNASQLGVSVNWGEDI